MNSFAEQVLSAFPDHLGDVVEIDALAWFTMEDGTVLDGWAYDFERSGDVLDFGARMTDGFTCSVGARRGSRLIPSEVVSWRPS